jgi:hypothetical protein
MKNCTTEKAPVFQHPAKSFVRSSGDFFLFSIMEYREETVLRIDFKSERLIPETLDSKPPEKSD